MHTYALGSSMLVRSISARLVRGAAFALVVGSIAATAGAGGVEGKAVHASPAGDIGWNGGKP